MLGSECGAPMVIVKHVGGQRSLELISVYVLHNFLFQLLLLFLLVDAFCWATARASCGNNSLFVLFSSLFLVSGAAGLRMLYKKFPWRAANGNRGLENFRR